METQEEPGLSQMTIINPDELFTLRNLALPLGLYIGVHKHWTPADDGGPFYVMPKKAHKDDRMPTLVKFQTAEGIEDFLNRYSEHYTGDDPIQMVPSPRD
jgi:hypothetical protein